MRYRKTATGEIVEFPAPLVAFDVSTSWERVEDDDGPDLSKLKRGELNQLATELGIEDADKLPNVGAVVEAIKQAQQA